MSIGAILYELVAIGDKFRIEMHGAILRKLEVGMLILTFLRCFSLNTMCGNI
jgi:hypothetical protein